MRCCRRYFLLCVPFAVSAFSMICLHQRHLVPETPSPSLDHWDIPQLAAYLNQVRVEVRAEPIPKGGRLSRSAFLTSAKRVWRDLNFLSKDSSRIREWRGIVYCERATSPDAAASLARQWGDRGLVVGPFVFYGDAKLLARISAALLLNGPPKQGQSLGRLVERNGEQTHPVIVLGQIVLVIGDGGIVAGQPLPKRQGFFISL